MPSTHRQRRRRKAPMPSTYTPATALDSPPDNPYGSVPRDPISHNHNCPVNNDTTTHRFAASSSDPACRLTAASLSMVGPPARAALPSLAQNRDTEDEVLRVEAE